MYHFLYHFPELPKSQVLSSLPLSSTVINLYTTKMKCWRKHLFASYSIYKTWAFFNRYTIYFIWWYEKWVSCPWKCLADKLSESTNKVWLCKFCNRITTKVVYLDMSVWLIRKIKGTLDAASVLKGNILRTIQQIVWLTLMDYLIFRFVNVS